MRQIKYLAINGFFAYSIYEGIINGNAGFTNIAVFFSWLTSFISLFYMTDAVMMNEDLNEKIRNPSAPVWFDLVFDLSVVCVFVFHGYIWLPAAYFFHITAFHAARDKAKKLYDNGIFSETKGES